MDELVDGCNFPIVVHSHLRWSGIWQRPQQIHSRLALRHPVTFIEEPIAGDGDPALECHAAAPGVLVVQPRIPEALLADHTMTERTIVHLLRDAADGQLRERTAGAVHWLYTPMMQLQVASFGRAAALVYDCMDELSQFHGAPAGLLRREAMLLSAADLVLCGGPALYDSKRQRHENVHAFGCGVDYEHFHRARETAAHEALASVPRPRLGYVGAIDERLDYELLASVARAHPEWSLVLVGPVVKVDPAVLPVGANVHLLGARTYDELPSLLAGFDICLMPFALNAATEFINPTKTLEYLCSGRPVLSTPVRDVVRGFSDVVTIAPAERFVAAAETLLAAREHDPSAGIARARSNTWDAIVAQMEQLVSAAVAARASVKRHGALDRLAGAPAAARSA
jgi:glycosyltransferase involved in cell wall biosynthesis